MKKLLLVAVLTVVGAISGCSDATLPHLVSIQVSPATPSVAAGVTQQFTATGTFSNAVTRDLTALVTWSSSTPYVATIASGGLATTYSQGTSTISASFTTPGGVITGTDTLTVTTPSLVSLVVGDTSTIVAGPNSIGTAKTATGTSHQFIAYGVYTDGGVRNITTSVTWSSSPLTVATITNAGRATGISPGTATITATDPTTSKAGTATLDVTSATVTTIVVSPVSQTIAPLTQITFSALGEFSDGTTQDITADVTWNSTNPGNATITSSPPSGIATGVSSGATVITASLGGVIGTAPLLVSTASLTSITLTPSTSGVAIGSTLQLNAVGNFSDGTKQPINLGAAWSVTPSDGSIATVNATGLVTGVAAGAATVKAQLGAVSATASLTVETVSSIAVTPAAATIAAGTATPFDAVATLADGTTQDVTSSVTWVSATPATAVVSDAVGSAGWAYGIAPGADTIGAVLDGQYALVKLTVTNATLSSLAITPATAQNIDVGVTQQYHATATFSDSSTQDLTDQVAWTSSAPAVAVINGSGLATSTGVGSTTVKAVGDINGNTATADVTLTVGHVVITFVSH